MVYTYNEREFQELKAWYENLKDDEPCDCEKFDRYHMMKELREFSDRLREMKVVYGVN